MYEFCLLKSQKRYKRTNFFFSSIALNAKDPEFYGKLTKNLNQEQCAGLKDVMVLAVQKKSHYESKLIEKKGGMYRTTPEILSEIFSFFFQKGKLRKICFCFCLSTGYTFAPPSVPPTNFNFTS